MALFQQAQDMPSAEQAAPEEVIPPPHKDPSIMNPAASADHVAERYYSAARLCQQGKVVKLRDGTTWQERHLYIKALELNPKFAEACHNLALALGEDEQVTVSGEEWDRKRLYTKAIQLDPMMVPSYTNLAAIMGPDERVRLGGSGGADRCSLLLHALHLDPRCGMTYLNLAACLPANSSVQLPSGQMVSAPSLVAMARQLDPLNIRVVPSAEMPKATPLASARVQSRVPSASPEIPVVVCQSPRLPTLLGGAARAGSLQAAAGGQKVVGADVAADVADLHAAETNQEVVGEASV
mmetsp:Transcript_41546/g.117659  ORF Transcript_41546/g.117659 Transcript_41546/m.117659 type:complete len:295 (-) Transcript_41546:365-1249(-)